MKVNKKIVVGILALVSISAMLGCSSTNGNFFRDRAFDYISDSNNRNMPIELPESKSTIYTTKQTLVFPKQASDFDDEKLVTPQEAILPPNFTLHQEKFFTAVLLEKSPFDYIRVHNRGIKFCLHTNPNGVASIVFIGDEHVIKQILSNALKFASYKDISYDDERRTFTFTDTQGGGYLLYLYPYVQYGSLFSNMKDWRNFFVKKQRQMRVSLFDTNQTLISVEKSESILKEIASYIS